LKTTRHLDPWRALFREDRLVVEARAVDLAQEGMSDWLWLIWMRLSVDMVEDLLEMMTLDLVSSREVLLQLIFVDRDSRIVVNSNIRTMMGTCMCWRTKMMTSSSLHCLRQLLLRRPGGVL